MTEYDLSEVAPDFPQKDISINIGIFWTFSTSDLTQVNLQIASGIHVLHPSKPKNFTLTRERRSPGKYEHRDLWKEAGPFRNCFWFSPKADRHKYLGFSEHFSPLICPKLTCKYPPKYMFCTLQNQKSSRWRVNWGHQINISTATYGRGAGPTMTNQKGLPLFTKNLRFSEHFLPLIWSKLTSK